MTKLFVRHNGESREYEVPDYDHDPMQEAQQAIKTKEIATGLLKFLKNMDASMEEGLISLLVAFVMLGKHMGKKRWEARRLFNMMAQEFADDGIPRGEVDTTGVKENLKLRGGRFVRKK